MLSQIGLLPGSGRRPPPPPALSDGEVAEQWLEYTLAIFPIKLARPSIVFFPLIEEKKQTEHMSGLEQSVAEKFRHILEQNQWVTPAPAAAAATAPIPPAPPAAPMATAPAPATSSYPATPQLIAGGGNHHLPSSPLMMLMFVLAVVAEAYFIYLVIDSLRNKSDTRDRR